MDIFNVDYAFDINGGKYKYKENIIAPISFLEDAASIDAIEYLTEESQKIKFVGVEKQRDLVYGSAIYVSQGENANGAYFFREELIKARKTPILKPVNIEHMPSYIVGVIYDSAVVTQTGITMSDKNIYYDNTEKKYNTKSDAGIDNNDNLDIKVNFAMYKYIFPDIVSEIMANQHGGVNKKYYVSMEVFYNEWGYLLNKDESTFMRVFRNEDGYEKYLKYEDLVNKATEDGSHVSKAYLDFTFGGMGIVENPANQRSYLFDLAKKTDFANKLENVIVVDNEFSGLEENITHTNEENLEAGMLTKEDQAAIEKLVTERMAANKGMDLSTARLSVLEDRISDLNDEKKSLETTVGSSKTEIDSLKSQLEEASSNHTEEKTKLQESIATITQEKDALAEELKKAQEAIAAIEIEKIGIARISEIEELGIDFSGDQEKKEKVFAHVSKLSEEDYAIYKESLSLALKSKPKKDEEEEDMEEDKKKAKKKSKDDKEDMEEAEEDKKNSGKGSEEGPEEDPEEDSAGLPDLSLSNEEEVFNAATSSSGGKERKILDLDLLKSAFAKVTTRDDKHKHGNSLNY